MSEKITTHLKHLFPGLLLVVTIAAAARFIAEHYGAPAMLLALLLGMAFHYLAEDTRTAKGIQLASGPLLRLGVALLGVRVTLEQIFSLGWGPLALIPGFGSFHAAEWSGLCAPAWQTVPIWHPCRGRRGHLWRLCGTGHCCHFART